MYLSPAAWLLAAVKWQPPNKQLEQVHRARTPPMRELLALIVAKEQQKSALPRNAGFVTTFHGGSWYVKLIAVSELATL
jgi:hypothetical protein